MYSKKTILILFIIYSITQKIFSSEAFNINVSAFSGIKYGETIKSIYLNDKNTKLSELVWEEKPIYELGLSSDISLWDFFIGFDFNYGIPTHVGNMYDSDWTTYGLKKTYTISQCELLNSFDTSLKFSYKTPKIFIFRIDPSIQIQYMFKNFNAHDGYGWYGAAQYAKEPRDYDVAWNDPLARKAKKIRDIDYYRHTLLTFFGFNLEIFTIDKLNLQTGFYISPFAYMYSYDTHHRSETNTHYVDLQYGYFSKFKTNLYVGWKFTDRIETFADFSAIFGTTDYGDLYHDEYSDTPTYTSNQPTSSNLWNIDVNSGIKINVK